MRPAVFPFAAVLLAGNSQSGLFAKVKPGTAWEETQSYMKSPRTITLFAEHSDSRRVPISLVASILVHGAAISLVSFGVLYTPPIDTHAAMDRFTVRRLDLHTPDQQAHHSPAQDVAYPGPRAKTHASGSEQAAKSLVMPPVPDAKRGPQTLVQPDIRTDLTLAQETPVPQVILWAQTKTPVVTIVAPLPAKPPTLNVKPVIERPNQEVNLRDITMSSSTQPSINQLLVPSTTTPIVVRGPQPTQNAAATVSQPSAKPTPAAVVSLSDVRMKNGTITLPPVNETAATNTSGALSLVSGPAKNNATPGNGDPASKANGNGAGPTKAPGTHAGEGTPGAAGNPAANENKITIVGNGLSPNATSGAGQGDQPSATAISMPKDGHFGSVIVGSSLEDQYPEIPDVWRGRMAYTVYLHVGLEKSWILQYSLPRSAEASDAGSVAHLDAPWPYNIVRPNLPAGSFDADALMIHGFVDIAGKFEALSVVFPPQFPQAQFVLDALAHWQFRPAYENGQIAKVEILLIIPEEFE